MALKQVLSNIEQLTPIRCEYRKGVKFNHPKVQKCFKQLERIPQNLQEIMVDQGAYLVFFHGLITDNPEFAHLKGKRPKGWQSNYTWDDIWAGHNGQSKAIGIGIDGNYVCESSEWFLHELGHSFDDRIGEYISWRKFFGKQRKQEKSLSKWGDVLQAIALEPFTNEYFEHPREYLANALDLFYTSNETNKQLRINNPTIFKLLSSLQTI